MYHTLYLRNKNRGKKRYKGESRESNGIQNQSSSRLFASHSQDQGCIPLSKHFQIIGGRNLVFVYSYPRTHNLDQQSFYHAWIYLNGTLYDDFSSRKKKKTNSAVDWLLELSSSPWASARAGGWFRLVIFLLNDRPSTFCCTASHKKQLMPWPLFKWSKRYVTIGLAILVPEFFYRPGFFLIVLRIHRHCIRMNEKKNHFNGAS